MPGKKFSKSIKVTFPTEQAVNSAQQAAQTLMDVRWAKKGPRHRDATETCLKVLHGHRSTEDAETTFIEAAREAGVLASD